MRARGVAAAVSPLTSQPLNRTSTITAARIASGSVSQRSITSASAATRASSFAAVPLGAASSFVPDALENAPHFAPPPAAISPFPGES